MHQYPIVQAKLQNNDSLFKQLLTTKVQFFKQLLRIYDYDDYQHILQCCTVLELNLDIQEEDDHSVNQVDIITGNLYLFYGNNVRIQPFQKPQHTSNTNNNKNDQSKEKSQNFNVTFCVAKKNQNRRQSKDNKKLMNKFLVNNNSVLAPIGQIYGLKYLFESQNKIVSTIYSLTSANLSNKAYVLNFEFSKLSETLFTKLKTYYSDKLKFLLSFSELKNIPKNLIQQNMNKFQVLKIHFNDILFDNKTRNKQLFFIQNGQLEVQGNKNYIIKAPISLESFKSVNFMHDKQPVLLSNNKQQLLQRAICRTSQCLIYTLSKCDYDFFQTSLKNNDRSHGTNNLKNLIPSQISSRSQSGVGAYLTGDSSHSTGKIQLKKQKYNFCRLLNTITSIGKQIQNQNQISEVKQNLIKPLYPGRYSCSQLKQNKMQIPKKQKLLQHFTNSLNDRFSQFQLLKMKQMQPYLDCQFPVLFEMKGRTCKYPEYQNMRNIYKNARIKKLSDINGKGCLLASDLCLIQAAKLQNEQSNHGQIQKKIQRKLNSMVTISLRKKNIIDRNVCIM